ncbi:MAG TPA: hypothetical protein VFT22_39190 [Kofleriaceae bacterium]|nr:hypothetical protein [Kofleriaceae bacterium]
MTTSPLTSGSLDNVEDNVNLDDSGSSIDPHAVWRRSNPRGLPMHELIGVIQEAGTRITRLTRSG